MTLWVAGITALALLVIAKDWRKGLFAVLLIGVLQDVFRKLTYGAPSYFVLWSTAIYACVVVMAVANRAVPHSSSFFLRDEGVRLTSIMFLALVALQTINSLIRYSSPEIAVLGGVFYLGPFVAMMVAISFVDSIDRIKQFLMVYLLIYVPVCLTVFLSPALAKQFPVLRDVGTFIGQELVIYDAGTRLSSNPGILRVGELAAWHAATCIMFLSILSLQSKHFMIRLVNSFLVVLLLVVIVLTGRRKMLAGVSIFLALQWGLLLWYRYGVRKLSMTLFAVAAVTAGTMVLYAPSENTFLYLKRSQTVYSSVEDRLELTWNLVKSAVDHSKTLGLGAGATSQGARFVGGGSKAAGGAAEAGLGKIIIELGVPGVVLLGLLMTLGGLKILGGLEALQRIDARLLVYQTSFIALVVTNFAAFAVASQLFGDLFVLIIVGTIMGFIVRIHNRISSG